MTSVATSAPPENSPTATPTRIFNLPDAPCFYPTEQEFVEPLKYIESIRPLAEKSGICKIIPPEGWKPPFALDTETQAKPLRMLQKLNSMEGQTRTNLNYLEQLNKFHRQQGHPIHKIPQLDKRPIDLFQLRKEVTARGGYHKVTASKKWAEIGRGLNYTRKQCTSMSNALKNAYYNIILPYENYLASHKQSMAGAVAGTKREACMDSSMDGCQDTLMTPAASPPSTDNLPAPTRRSKRIKKETHGKSVPSSPPASQSDRMSTEPAPVKTEEASSDGSSRSMDPKAKCEICQTGGHLDKMLICEGCELGHHSFCVTPALQHVPKSDWYCTKCLIAGEDFGFEEGEEYSLSSFQEKCNSFKKEWFESQGHPDGKVTEDVVEREFWRLVENAFETAEVEYGADLHSSQHGSGFPMRSRDPDDEYSAHPFNLNNIPTLTQSLFRHIKSDISGMMVPWLYVGMCFSTFCWHNEDHYTYSINYMHWGETKTWYGIPASDALKFEDTMRDSVPELFEHQPDLLFQLVTMLSPGRLVENGVKVVALDQRPGQFVVTFPQAYHAGFNHGFNFAEAVNFAPPDWCQFGVDCALRYKEHRKHPVFSHDELIITTALRDTSVETAQWLQHELRKLLDRELADRASVLNQYPSMRVVIEEVDRPEEEVQCSYCNSYIYLSQVGCSCGSKVTCGDHISELCKCDASEHFLRLRFSDQKLEEIGKRVTDSASSA
ncbi:hypothetical protein BGX31_002584 [Mortierella sp. GBA43]|nr:hypothetical protein BGX31_002584 [Mortierella sp. GBA43]